MVTIESVSIDWLVLLINGYAAQPQEAAGSDAVPAERVCQDQPALAARVTNDEKRRLADGLWPVFAGPSPDQQVAVFDELLATITVSPHVDMDGRLSWSTPLDEPADALAASCIVSLLGAITTYGWAKLGTCAGCDCVDVYVDSAGRGQPRKYCSPTCLNRTKVRAFRSRHGTS